MSGPDQLPLPARTRALIARTDLVERHPGLQLDKYVPLLTSQRPDRTRCRDADGGKAPGFQEVQRLALSEACTTRGDASLLAALLHRRRQLLDGLSAITWTCRTTAPLTLHLTRASALENAGICLHPVYGFACLPGSGLKGLARAFAETAWLPMQADRDQAQCRIEEVFGRAPGPGEGGAPAGSIVFHDAWPEEWPRLEIDIVNNHHARYYRGDSGEDDPGDWDEPSMVTFLCIAAGATFSFALSKRHPGAGAGLLRAARDWLISGLSHRGAGAKTAAGYGGFAPPGPDAVPAPVAQETFEGRLELVTPAFLAGASQGRDDCDLRAPTLRGLLRWWWRTMHVGHVDRPTLRRLEAAVWGDTSSGSPVRVTLAPDAREEPARFPSDMDERGRPRPARAFVRGNDLQRPGAPKTAQGLFYLAYGMFEKERWHLRPGARWRVQIVARPSRFSPPGGSGDREARALAVGLVLSQATAALWLLCHHVGVGSKARKGFGSFADVAVEGLASIEDCRRLAADFRIACGLGDQSFRPDLAGSPALAQAVGPIAIHTPWTNAWFALDQLGFASQAFAKQYKRRPEKRALGLPRLIGGSAVLAATEGKGTRHASPVLYHLARGEAGGLIVRAVAFPAKHVPPAGDRPDVDASRVFLTRYLHEVKTDLEARTTAHADKGRARPPAWQSQARGAIDGQDRRSAPSTPPRAGDRVRAVLLAEKTKRGGWKARHVGTGLSGEIQNSPAVPAGMEPGAEVVLQVKAVYANGISFHWPTP